MVDLRFRGRRRGRVVVSCFGVMLDELLLMEAVLYLDPAGAAANTAAELTIKLWMLQLLMVYYNQ